jgi:hypothetical protein
VEGLAQRRRRVAEVVPQPVFAIENPGEVALEIVEQVEIALGFLERGVMAPGLDRAKGALESDELVTVRESVLVGVTVDVDAELELVDSLEARCQLVLTLDAQARRVVAQLHVLAGSLVGILQGEVDPAIDVRLPGVRLGRRQPEASPYQH